MRDRESQPVVCGVTVRICLTVVIVVTNTQYAINDWKLLWLFCGLPSSADCAGSDGRLSSLLSAEWRVVSNIIVE